jgi:uncharacterized protein (TIGR00288 family)
MAERVAVYIDFDNVVISRYDNIHDAGAWRKDDARRHRLDAKSSDPVDVKLAQAQVDLGAIIDYAASFGTVAFTRAYADWSITANAAYREPLVGRAVELVQLFPASGTKNGADIRLAVDAMTDLVRHPDITHVALVAGDSDYVPLAQEIKRAGRFVVGIGVTGATSKALVSACDEFTSYSDLPGVTPPVKQPVVQQAPAQQPAAKSTSKKTAAKKAATKKAAAKPESQALTDATQLLVRAVRVGLQKSDDEWIYAAGVKSQMQRMNPAFKEKSLGFSSFRAFVESRSDVVESKVDNAQLLMRLR